MPTPFDTPPPFTPDALAGTSLAPRTPFDMGAAAPMPVARPPIAPMAPVRTPPFVAPQAPAEKAPNFLSMVLPILTSTMVGRKDPRAIASGLAGFMKGRELKRAERESTQQTAERKQAEQADFYSRALTQAQTFDDPVAFEQWKHAIAPVAQLHGIDPNVFAFNDSKRLAREKKEAADLLDTLDKRHPDGNYTAEWKGRRITRAELESFAGVSAFDGQGTPLGPATPKGEPFTLSEGQTRYGADGKRIADGPAKKKTPIRVGNQLVDPDTMKPVYTAPAKPGGTGNSDLVQAVLDNPELYDRLSSKQIADIAPALNAAGFKGFGKTMNESAITQIANTASALKSLQDLRETLKANEQYIGPIAGLQALNPYSDARKAQAKIDLVKQRVGKALEGGVLRKEDEDKYKKILATLNDTPATAIYKVDSIIATLERDRDTFVDAQRSAGRRVPTTGGPAIGERRTFNGRLGEWDGKGWLPVGGTK